MACSGKRKPIKGWYFHGSPPLDLPKADEIHISCTFTWDKPEAEELFKAWSQYYPVVKIGGPAYGHVSTDFQPGQFVKQGVTFTSRGCNNNCPWCLVRSREGQFVEVDNFPAGNDLLDNNLLQSSSSHLDKVFSMLNTQHAAIFSGGLEAARFTDEVVDRMRSIKINQLFFAADTSGAITPLKKALSKLKWLPVRRIRCYVLIGFNGETIEQAETRLKEVFLSGCLPYAMLYQPPTETRLVWPIEWRQFARKWQRPAIIKSMMKTGQK